MTIFYFYYFKFFFISFDKALLIDSKYLAAWGYKGIVFYELGKYEKAIEC